MSIIFVRTRNVRRMNLPTYLETEIPLVKNPNNSLLPTLDCILQALKLKIIPAFSVDYGDN